MRHAVAAPGQAGDTYHHHGGIVDDNINPASGGVNIVGRRPAACFIANIEFEVAGPSFIMRDGADAVGFVLAVAGEVAHRGIDFVASAGELKRGLAAEAGTVPCDDD